MQAFSLRELELEAQRRLDPAVYDYFAGGADDEITVRSNEAAFAHIGLLPRVLRGAGAGETGDHNPGLPPIDARPDWPNCVPSARASRRRTRHRARGSRRGDDHDREHGFHSRDRRGGSGRAQCEKMARGTFGFRSTSSPTSASPNPSSDVLRRPVALLSLSQSTLQHSDGGNATCATASTICPRDVL